MCKVVYVKDVEVIRGGQMDPLPPPGQTELPSCPVCLERLDEHVSGVITTVRVGDMRRFAQGGKVRGRGDRCRNDGGAGGKSDRGMDGIYLDVEGTRSKEEALSNRR